MKLGFCGKVSATETLEATTAADTAYLNIFIPVLFHLTIDLCRIEDSGA
jgi:hypothetical protein